MSQLKYKKCEVCASGVASLFFLYYFFSAPTVMAEESLFKDELSFDSVEQELDSYSDSDDVFEAEETNNNKYPGLGVKLSHKLSVNPADNWETTKQRTELTLDIKGLLPRSGYGELQINAKRYWPNDSSYATEISDIEVERAFIQFSSEKWSTKLGKYTIGWGEIEGGPLDVINPIASLTDPIPESQWLISTTRYWNNSNLSFFYNQSPNITKIANVNLNDKSNSEFGLRFDLKDDIGDSSIYLARLVPNSALKDIANGDSKAHPYQLLGYSANQAIEGYLIKYDIAYKNNLKHNRSGSLVSVDRIDWGIALDRQKEDRQWLFTINSKHLVDYYSDFLTPNLTQNVSTRRHNLSYSLSVNDAFDNSDYKWNILASSTSNGDMKLLSTGIDWDISDQWSSSINGTKIIASSDREFSILDGYERVGIELNYHY